MSAGAGAARAERLEALLSERELDALLVTNLVSLRYLTGFSGTNGAALCGPGARVFATDFRYTDRAAREVPGFDRIQAKDDMLKELLAGLPEGASRLGFDDRHMTVHAHGKLLEKLPEGIEAVAAGGLVEKLRAVKDDGELAAIRAAAALADEALRTVVLEPGFAGRSERRVAIDLERAMVDAGAGEPAFPPIVAAGPNGAQPHAESGESAIPADTFVVVDWGARLDGYCSDCTRTFATGELGDDAEEVYEVVRSSQEAALAAVRPDAGCREVDAVAREAIAAAGHGERFGHGLGHGVGLEVHEDPTLSPRAEKDSRLAAGNVVTVEPGVYVSGELGVRIEDLVVVADDGPEVLSSHPKTLMRLDP